MNYLERARRVLAIEIEELQRLSTRLDHHFERAIELLRKTLDRHNKIIILGVGKSGHIGEKIAATLTSTGAPGLVLHSLNALHGDLGVVADGDLFLILSYSGETDEILRLLPVLARFDAKRIAITGNIDSTLAKASDVVLDVHVAQEACPHNLAPTSSTTTMLALGDALAMVLLEARGFTRENFARFHPGGQLGQSLLVRVRDIMHQGEAVVMVSPEALVMDVLKQLVLKRSGAAIVVTPERELAGIFTHGDFVRHFAANPNIGQEQVGRVMTHHPVTINADRLAGEVLVILEQHRVDDLIVVADDGRPLGMIDSQDLSRLKIL
jgi:arabinose-5-phosphate isomerase